ncbi:MULTISPECIES: O-antigen ligase family protein [unclassified Microbacterium]|uniref:O-antigen ligase family protein n=1 Tax=unclassified Microbacterium TaxID=2609290 RepID=UPI00214BA70D|nr:MULTISPECIES: O-antigen ligase family protein [unclassified Microbacterium]MCR2785004.1 O-antigen ligase family protein [Microbacterium sp. zg.B96]WIM16543.1 O-antigen ligase family protein [Microbacterium sp. zg-B96]
MSRHETGDAVTWLTLYLLVLYAVPSRLVVGPLGSAGAPSMLLGILSLGLWVSMLVTTARPGTFAVASPTKWAVAVFVACVGVSYALTMSQPVSADEVSPADVALLALASWVGTMLLTCDGVRSRRRLDALVWRFAVAGGLLALVGLAQFLSGRALVDLISVPGLTSVADAALFSRNGLVRPSGTAIHPIEYGALLTVILPLALHVALRRTDLNRWVRWAPALAILAAVAVSSSRSAYLGAIIGVVISAVAWGPKARKVAAIVLGAGLLLVAIAIPRLLNSIVGLFAGADEDPSIASRTDSFGFAWHFIVDSPVFGRGLGTFLPKYRIFDNQYLGMLVTLGIAGTAAFVAIGVVAISQLLRVRRTARDADTAPLAVSLVGAVAAGFASLAFFDAFAFPMTMGTIFLVLGMAGALARLTATAERKW